MIEGLLKNEFALTDAILLLQNVTLWYMAFVKRNK